MDCCNHHNGLGWVARWMGFTDYAPTVPQLYWNVDGNEQRYHLLCKQLHKLVCYADMLGQKIDLDHAAIDELEKQFEKFMESGFDDYYKAQIEAWIEAHMPDIIGKYVRMVFFGLTLDGYFVAYIPEGTGWDDIVFDTGAVYGSDEYGRLILNYAVDGEPQPVDQGSEPSRDDFEQLQQLIAALDGRVTHNESTLYTGMQEVEA